MYTLFLAKKKKPRFDFFSSETSAVRIWSESAVHTKRVIGSCLYIWPSSRSNRVGKACTRVHAKSNVEPYDGKIRCFENCRKQLSQFSGSKICAGIFSFLFAFIGLSVTCCGSSGERFTSKRIARDHHCPCALWSEISGMLGRFHAIAPYYDLQVRKVYGHSLGS
ncbi:hypothetical protein L873DRAFT_774264 [Choiromyces venosus 120613-1]|uniref:Uncharacterized protein n=1 Tax=Choiromyces venosus 120613-1 TaxID=1336337 RepID=A0A3N4JQB1_9PEZI|nr:hypothetical protein L873DRAFT_774264 [Choiromyces venosus 120613-1]